MNGDQIIYLLWGGLAIALISAAITDIKSREISNWLNLGIALTAPIAWIASGLAFWPDMVVQIGVALIVFIFFAGMFAIGAMGGGDVKLLAALALWLHWVTFVQLVVIMSIAGGAITIMMMVRKKLRKSDEKLEIPYGVAISFAGLWVIAERFINQFA
ncbi:MAG: prepilin peptidase [Parasphingorhabdus sp.]|nr:prepilin peptidase [Parasphingorhabdus sp.]